MTDNVPQANAEVPQWMHGWNPPEGALPEGPTYPTAQWFNGGQGNESPVLKTGGWELPARWFRSILGDSEPTFDVEHSGAESGADPAYLFKTLHLAAVMKHDAYYKGNGNGRVWATQYQDGFYSRVRLLGFVQEIEAIKPLTPVVLTFRSAVARDFYAVARQFRAEVIDPANQLAGDIAVANELPVPPNFLPYAFWLPIGAANKRVKVGSKQKSFYAPLVGGWDGLPDLELLLQTLATPAELREFVRETFYEEAREWLEAQKKELAELVAGGGALAKQSCGHVVLHWTSPQP